MVDPLVFGAVDVVVMPDICDLLSMLRKSHEQGMRLEFCGVPIRLMSRDELIALVARTEQRPSYVYQRFPNHEP